MTGPFGGKVFVDVVLKAAQDDPRQGGIIPDDDLNLVPQSFANCSSLKTHQNGLNCVELLAHCLLLEQSWITGVWRL